MLFFKITQNAAKKLFEPTDDRYMSMQYQGNISSRFSSNSEEDASELLENREEMSFVSYNRRKIMNK